MSRSESPVRDRPPAGTTRPPFVSPGSIARQDRQLRTAGRDAEFHDYPGTGHWFFEWDRPDTYDAPAAHLAWVRTIEFLDRHLPCARR